MSEKVDNRNMANFSNGNQKNIKVSNDIRTFLN